VKPVPKGYTGVAVVKFEAYSNGSTGLLDAIHAKSLPSWAQAAQYDAELWAGTTPPLTPPIEQGAWLYNSAAGVSYAQLFCEKAHGAGLAVALTPGNDLCNDHPNSAYGGVPQYPLNGQTDYNAYVSHNLASAAKWLSPGDVYEYQAQPLETMTPIGQEYGKITKAVAKQVSAVSSGVTMLTGIGRSNADDEATAADLHTDASSVAGYVSGFWPNVSSQADEVAAMIGFLQLLGY
jgi:hypothetical protein